MSPDPIGLQNLNLQNLNLLKLHLKHGLSLVTKLDVSPIIHKLRCATKNTRLLFTLPHASDALYNADVSCFTRLVTFDYGLISDICLLLVFLT
jgi:hypothetical protein